MGNASGTYRTTRENMMQAFDKLPAEARQALANSLDNFVAQPLLTEIRRGLTPEQAAKRVARWDASEAMQHRARMVRMAQTGMDYNRPIRPNTVRKLAAEW